MTLRYEGSGVCARVALGWTSFREKSGAVCHCNSKQVGRINFSSNKSLCRKPDHMLRCYDSVFERESWDGKPWNVVLLWAYITNLLSEGYLWMDGHVLVFVLTGSSRGNERFICFFFVSVFVCIKRTDYWTWCRFLSSLIAAYKDDHKAANTIAMDLSVYRLENYRIYLLL